MVGGLISFWFFLFVLCFYFLREVVYWETLLFGVNLLGVRWVVVGGFFSGVVVVVFEYRGGF